MCGCRGGFPAAAGASPVPTTTCPGAGNADSYVYDDFARVSGYWNMGLSGSSQVAGGVMKPVSASTGSVEAGLLVLPSANPAGADVVTIEAKFNCTWDTSFNYTGAIYMGGGFGNHYAGVGSNFGLGGRVFFVQSVSIGDIFNVAIPANASFVVKIEITATQILSYLDGVLKHTRAVVGTPLTINSRLRTSNILPTASIWADYFKFFGKGLPVQC